MGNQLCHFPGLWEVNPSPVSAYGSTTRCSVLVEIQSLKAGLQEGSSTEQPRRVCEYVLLQELCLLQRCSVSAQMGSSSMMLYEQRCFPGLCFTSSLNCPIPCFECMLEVCECQIQSCFWKVSLVWFLD